MKLDFLKERILWKKCTFISEKHQEDYLLEFSAPGFDINLSFKESFLLKRKIYAGVDILISHEIDLKSKTIYRDKKRYDTKIKIQFNKKVEQL